MAYNEGTDPTLAELISRYWVPSIYSKNVVDHTKSKLVVAESVNTEYQRDLKVGSTVYIPVTTEATAAEVTPGTALTASDVTTTGKSLTVDKWYGSKAEISEMANIQDPINYLSKAAQSCAYAIAKQLDTHLGACFSSLGGYTTSAYGTDGQTLTDDIIIYLMETLDESDVPEDDRCIITDPSSKADLLKIDKFVRNDYVRNPVVPTGKFGDIYNMEVKITNNLTAATTGHYGVMMHRDALASIVQANPYSQKINDPKYHRIIFQVKIIYGYGELRDTFGIPFYTRKS